MASVQNSKKQGHLEAGKRRLEEFRKKKAEAKAKKAAVAAPSESDAISQHEKSLLESEKENIRNLDNANNIESSRPSFSFDNSPFTSVHSFHPDSSHVAVNSSVADVSDKYNNSSSYSIPNRPSESESNEGLYTHRLDNGYNSSWRDTNSSEVSKYTEADIEARSTRSASPPDLVQEYRDLSEDNRQSGFFSFHEHQLEDNGISSSGYVKKDCGSSAPFTHSFLGKYHSSNLQHDVDIPNYLSNQASTASYGDTTQLVSNLTKSASTATDQDLESDDVPRKDLGSDVKINFNSGWLSEMREKKLSSDDGIQSNVETAPWRNSGGFFSDSGVNVGSSFKQSTSLASEIEARRSHPPFLDSQPKASTSPHFLYREAEKDEKSSPFGNFRDYNENPPALTSWRSSVENGDVDSLARMDTSDHLNTEKPLVNNFSSIKEDNFLFKYDVPVPNRDEDFSALEQHIEDLTQEKFALQRSLEASRTLAESLAAENSSLTDSYNQQGTAVNQLKSDMERLQEEIKDQLAVLEAVKMEYANIQLECNAADERSNILASEVIGLEEKALRLRSNELKLERELENVTAEVKSYKRKMSSLEKEHRELQATIDALQEEKKMLQSKLRKASSSGSVIDKSKPPVVTKDISTSTQDLDVEVSNAESSILDPSFHPVGEHHFSSIQSSNVFSVPFPHESSESYVAETSTAIPPDQLRTIGNIDSLIAELSLEKEELLRALAVESSTCSELKALNKDLSQKLEVQTQRLELLTAQRMASENILANSVDANVMQDNLPYPDEGDEVVERVLGWIMKLFPGGGPAKRRTSKLL